MTGAAFWNWLSTGWTAADFIALALTLIGLIATYRQARKAKDVAEATQQNVTQEIGRIKATISSFRVLERIHASVASLDAAEFELNRSEWEQAVYHFGKTRESVSLLMDETLACVKQVEQELLVALSYLNNKAAAIVKQVERGNVTESPGKIQMVLAKHRLTLRRLERALEVETFDGGQ